MTGRLQGFLEELLGSSRISLSGKPEVDRGAGGIDGTHSSLVEAGVDASVTLAGGDFATAERLSLQNLIDGQAKEGVRYVVESELARGGMGAVMRAVDCDIRREVAVKYLLDPGDAKKKLRFVEEAQITGQLEHPNIVPIHELGIDAHKRIFFSMKMVKGRSLAEILKALRREPEAPARDSASLAGPRAHTSRRNTRRGSCSTSSSTSATPSPMPIRAASLIATSSRPTSWSAISARST